MRHLSVVALLLGIGSAGAQQNVTTIKSLRMKILSDMDPKVPPSMGPGPWGQGNQVKVQFRVFKVLEVDISSGRLRFKAWRRMRWFDDRLKWNPDEFDGINEILVYPGSHSLDNNLWLPDIVTYNSAQLSSSAFEPGAAWVNSSGHVHYSAAGLLDLTCRYSGLVRFPRDELSCPMEIAFWSTSDLITNLTFFDEPEDNMTTSRVSLGDRGCAEIAPQSAATAPSYQEYHLAPKVDCLKYTRTYPCCADVPWTQLWIVFYIQHSTTYYLYLVEIPSIFITVLSFGQFWMKEGTRVAFGATTFLTSYVLFTKSEDSVPRCGEFLWLNLFTLVSMLFCVAALLQTIIVHIGHNCARCEQ